MFSKILVALDQGDTCTALFQQAVKLAQATQAELMLLSVIPPEGNHGVAMPSSSGLPYYSLAASESLWMAYQANLQKFEDEGLERLQIFQEKAQTAGICTEFTQAFGNPGRIICNLAGTWDADLILVGSHGRKGIKELFLGSISNYVMHHAPCSVLVAKAQTVAEAETVAETIAETANLTAV